MKVSIAMATYNGEKYVKEQMESLRIQTRPPDEVIIIDDCSTDATPDIIQSYVTKHNLANWSYSLRSENQGYIHTFREAFAQTTGDIIFLCDQDDVWFPEKIETMVRVMEANSNIHVISCDDIETDEHLAPKPIRLKFFKSHNNRIEKRIRGAGACIPVLKIPPQCGVGCFFAVTRILCEKYLRLPVYTMPHDTALAIMATLTETLFYLNTPLVYRRKHYTNVSNQYKRSSSLEVRLAQVQTRLHQFSDLPVIIQNFEPLNKWQTRCQQISRYFIRWHELRLKFLQQSGICSLLCYGLYTLYHCPKRARTFCWDVLLTFREKIWT